VDPLAPLREADALHLDRRYEDAGAAYRRAVQADPSLLEAWYGLGCVCASLYAYGDAIAALRRVVSHRPDAFGARCILAEALFQLGELDSAVIEYRLAAEGGDPEVQAIARSAVACIAPGSPGLNHAAVRAVRENWVASIGNGIRPTRPSRDQATRKLRIGYVSAFFGAAQLDEAGLGRDQSA
jgi:tetratricopeptide (TPR) repeat protein